VTHPGMARTVQLTDRSVPANVVVRDAAGAEIAHVWPATSPITTVANSAPIGSITVQYGNLQGNCDLAQGAGWLNSTSKIGVTALMQNGQLMCGIHNLAESGTYPDRAAVTTGSRCMYVSDLKGNGGIQCRMDIGGSMDEVTKRRS